MSINAISNRNKANNVSYAKKKSDKKEVETTTIEKEPSTMKKIGRGAASAVIPGAGQVMNGDYKKAGWIIAGNILLPQDSILKDALRGYAAYDAYKNTTPTVEKQPKTEDVKEKA